VLIRNRGVDPKIDPSAYVAPTAVLVGRVTVNPRVRIMYGAVLDSEASKVEVGECAIVCENAVLRTTSAGSTDLPVMVGDHAFVGPHATLLGCVVEPACYVATGATILQGATVESGAAVAVGALVHANSKVPSEFFVPPNTFAVGDPLHVYAPGG
jgi:carbonic anhydrase/acetyltransferase-like protein (isoleucine patch superfamily)